MKKFAAALIALLWIGLVLAVCCPQKPERDDPAAKITNVPIDASAASIEETGNGVPTNTAAAPTVDSLTGVTIEVYNLADSDLVPPRMTLRGTYAGLEPEITSIHVLLQPLSAGENVFPVEEAFSVPYTAGEWSIPVLFGDDESLAAPENYSVFVAFTASEEARAELATGIDQGFPLSELPAGVFVVEEVTSVKRQAYAHVQEYRLLYNTIYLHDGVKSMDIVSISLADPEDNDYRRLTDTAVAEVQPALCSGNQKIAFVQIRGYHVEEEPNWAIWIMDSDGQHMEALIDEAKVVYDKPVWSADCRYIAYAAMDREAGPERWVITLLEYANPYAEPIQLAPGRYPSWVPDESRLELVFENRGTLYRLDVDACLETVNQETCEAAFLTGERLTGTHPAVSPDKKWLAFASIPTLDETSGDYSQDIYLVDLVRGGDPIPIAANPNLDWRPVWGPDSQALYFESGRTPYFSVFAVSLDGSDLQLLTDPGVEDQNPQIDFQDAYFPLEVGD
jgi:hypothetical protein